MHFSLLTIRGRGDYPWVVVLFLLAHVTYQFFSGKLLDLRWNIWVTREKSPKKYWSILSIEAAVVLVSVGAWVWTWNHP